MTPDRRLALLIDGDNAQASLLPQMLNAIDNYGTTVIRRVYGDWTEPQMKSWKDILNVHAFQLVQQFRYTNGKNATDSALIIDAMDILYTAKIDGFCLVSSDSDFTRLATRIREKNLFVMGIGKNFTPRPFVDACDVFIYTESLTNSAKHGSKPAKPQPPAAPSTNKPANTTKIATLLAAAFKRAPKDNGWATLAAVGSALRQLDPAFDTKTYGYKQLHQLIEAHSKLIEIRKKGNPPIYSMRMRAKR